MNHDYDDIRSKIAERPQWFDENAVPRYVVFAPDHLSNIYAREGALVEIACQACQTRFKVAFSRDTMDDVRARMGGREPRLLADFITGKTIHYGDPPNVRCCPGGPTMNSDPLRVIEYWRRDDSTNHEWQRNTALEIDVSEFPSACGEAQDEPLTAAV
jgi:hypothetical protein